MDPAGLLAELWLDLDDSGWLWPTLPGTAWLWLALLASGWLRFVAGWLQLAVVGSG